MVNSVALPPLPEAFPWLSPRISFGHDPTPVAPPEGRPDGHAEDFEFRRHDDPVTMLPADELFSGCKLVPFQLAAPESVIARSKPPETDRKVNIAGPDSYAFSPRAPRCTTLWRELLGLRRAPTTPPGVQVTAPVTSAAVPAASKNPILRSSIKHLLHRRHKPASPAASLSLPLLGDSIASPWRSPPGSPSPPHPHPPAPTKRTSGGSLSTRTNPATSLPGSA
ncbi:hypothetical protein B296_00009173 [Ensete ventricosum]|uniref:Uncharacterized protein n=1 Tax=Ensete ventricosum TaxID=4639 RepID=A0A427A470_ENSVE|nr:hypothetical protein B296_00009173 [Ensete ventricosum]